MVKTMLASDSGSFLIRGALAILIGLAAIFFPGPTLAGLLGVFAAYAVIDGSFAVWGAVRGSGSHHLWLLLGGIAAIAVGLLTVVSPGTTALVLVLWIGIIAIARGAAEIGAAYTLRNVIRNAALVGLLGVVSIIFGLYLIVAPGAGALALLWLIGIYALFTGAMYLALGFRLRTVANALAM